MNVKQEVKQLEMATARTKAAFWSWAQRRVAGMAATGYFTGYGDAVLAAQRAHARQSKRHSEEYQALAATLRRVRARNQELRDELAKVEDFINELPARINARDKTSRTAYSDIAWHSAQVKARQDLASDLEWTSPKKVGEFTSRI